MTVLIALLLLAADADAAPPSFLAQWSSYGLPPIPDSVRLGTLRPQDQWRDHRHRGLGLFERRGDQWTPWSPCLDYGKVADSSHLGVSLVNAKTLRAEAIRDYQVFDDRFPGLWFSDFHRSVELAVFLDAHGNAPSARAAFELVRGSDEFLSNNRFLRSREFHQALACNAFAYWLRRYVEAEARPAAEEAALRLRQVLPDLPTSLLADSRRTVEGILARLQTRGSSSDVDGHLGKLLDAEIGAGAWQPRSDKTDLRRHPSYQAVVALGVAGVPALLQHADDPRLGRIYEMPRRGPARLTSAGELAAMLIEEALFVPVPRRPIGAGYGVRRDFVADLLSRPAMFGADAEARDAAQRKYVAGEKEAYGRLTAAIRKDDVKGVYAELDARPWLAAHPDNPIVDAVNNSFGDAAERLLACGADPNAAWYPNGAGSTPFARAVDCAGYSVGRARLHAELLAVVRDMTALGGDPKARSPKHGIVTLESAMVMKDEQVATVLASRVPVDADFGGYGPLHAAVFLKNARVAAQLLDRGADPEARTAVGESPLDLASRVQSKPLADVLIKGGAKRSLHHAAAVGEREAVEQLLKEGADVNAPDEGLGLTPLAWAAFGIHPEVEAILTARGASKHVKIKEFDASWGMVLPRLLPSEIEIDLDKSHGTAKLRRLFFGATGF